MSRNKFFFLAAAVVVLRVGLSRANSSIPITLIADTTTPDPSGGGDFTSFGIPSSDRDNSTDWPIGPNQYYFSNSVYFTAQGNGLSGVYIAVFPAPGITEISTIADTMMTAATGGNFASFSNTTSGNGVAGFVATDSNGAQSIYAYDGYGLHTIATTITSPMSETTFGNFQSISFMEGDEPRGEIESTSGIYTFADSFIPTFALIANTSTIPSGASTPFTSFGPVSYKPGNPNIINEGYAYPESAVLATVNNVQGIYYSLNTGNIPLHKLVDANSPVPNGSGDFTSFGNPVATASFIEFTAGYSTSNGPQQGIFIYGPYLHGGNVSPPTMQDIPTLQELLAGGTLAPDSNGAHFASFLAIGNNENLGGDSLSDTTTYTIPFLATLDNGVEGLFCTTGFGTSVKILDTGDILNGKTVSNITLSPDAAGYVFTTFGVDFTDGSQALYYFDTNVLPEPGLLGLLTVPALLMLRRK